MSRIAIYDSQGNHVAGDRFGGNMAKKGFFAGLKFFADVKRREVVYHCFFRGRPSGGSRAEQYFVEYEGDIESFTALKNQIEEAMISEHGQDFEFAKTDDDFLFDLVGVSERSFGYRPSKIKGELKAGEQLEFKAGGHRAAAGFVDFLMDIETSSGDKHATIGVADNFNQIKEPEVAIQLDSSVSGIEEVDKHRQENKDNTGQQVQFNSDKPSGPGEWIKSKIPLI